MSPTPSRRFIIAALLLITAVVGALLRVFADPQSTAYDVGTLLMVMWVPAVGNFISFFVNKARSVATPPPAFTAATPFVPQLAAELRWFAPQGPNQSSAPDKMLHCLLVAGTEGFSARLSLPDRHATGDAVKAEVQFLFPNKALPKFPVGGTFQIMQGRSAIGTGRVQPLSPMA